MMLTVKELRNFLEGLDDKQEVQFYDIATKQKFAGWRHLSSVKGGLMQIGIRPYDEKDVEVEHAMSKSDH